MAATIGRYLPSLLAEATGGVDFENDVFRVLLLRETALPDLSNDSTRADILADELPTGGGYTTGGQFVEITPSLDGQGGVLSLAIAGVSWPGADFSTQAAVYYRDSGTGLPADDLLIAGYEAGEILTPVGEQFDLPAMELPRVVGAPSAGGGGHVIQDEGVDLPQRANLNFNGAGVEAADDAENDTTTITIPGGVVGPPQPHAASHGAGQPDEITPASIGAAADGAAPAAHAASHGAGQPDEITPASIGAATAAQGAKADTAVQPDDLATVATTGAYGDLSGLPTLGSAAVTDATDYATAAQGATADAAAADLQKNHRAIILATSMNAAVANSAPDGTIDFATSNNKQDVVLFDSVTQQSRYIVFPFPRSWDPATNGRFQVTVISPAGSTPGDTATVGVAANFVPNGSSDLDIAFPALTTAALIMPGVGEARESAWASFTPGSAHATDCLIAIRLSRPLGGTMAEPLPVLSVQVEWDLLTPAPGPSI